MDNSIEKTIRYATEQTKHYIDETVKYINDKSNAYAREFTSQYTREADKYANSYGIFWEGGHNNAYDAYRHAYTSAAMTMERGEKSAWTLGEINELHGDINHHQKPQEKNMDRWNNAAGRKIGLNSSTKDEIAKKVYDAIKNKELIIDVTKDARKYYTSSISPAEMHEMRLEFVNNHEHTRIADMSLNNDELINQIKGLSNDINKITENQTAQNFGISPEQHQRSMSITAADNQREKELGLGGRGLS
jgi:hypothetical protein